MNVNVFEYLGSAHLISSGNCAFFLKEAGTRSKGQVFWAIVCLEHMIILPSWCAMQVIEKSYSFHQEESG